MDELSTASGTSSGGSSRSTSPRASRSARRRRRRSGLGVSASTVRGELAELESLGLLTHPHTSAGRIPTDSGYRFYAGEVLERQVPRPERFPLDLTSMRSEVEAALQSTTEMLGQVTRLLALVSAPGHETATVRHIEVLLLQPSVVDGRDDHVRRAASRRSSSPSTRRSTRAWRPGRTST